MHILDLVLEAQYHLRIVKRNQWCRLEFRLWRPTPADGMLKAGAPKSARAVSTGQSVCSLATCRGKRGTFDVLLDDH